MFSNQSGDENSLILASGSVYRARMLSQAGLEFQVMPSAVDEDEIKRAMIAERAGGGDIALALADLKARRISGKAPSALVVGADQLLECSGVFFDKPPDRAAADQQLRHLRGKTHRLHTAAVVLRDGRMIWHHIEVPALTMRPFSDDFLARYLDRAGDALTQCVGAYELEGLGIHLFDAIEGDYFSVLGLPLGPLLGFLRQHGYLIE